MKLSEHFDSGEFVCKCGCGAYVRPPQLLIDGLERLRHAVGVPVVITSGTRCRRHNAAVGGVYNSLHLTGSAADISIPALSLDTCCLATLGRYVARLHAIDEHARHCCHLDVKGLKP